MRAKITVDINDLHPSGNGIAHNPQFGHIYVPFTFPGERLDVTLREEIRPGKWHADRVALPAAHCSHAGRCGGCVWPGAPYAEQLTWKKTLLLRAARAIPQLASLPVNLHAAPQVSGFRNRVHLHANFFHGDLEFGFYGRGSRALIAIEDCPVAEAPLREVMSALAGVKKGGWPASENFGFGIELIHLREENSKIMMILYASPLRKATLAEAIPRFAALDPNLLVREAFSSQEDVFVWQRLPGATMYTKPGVFQQGNTAQSDTIRGLIAAEISARRPDVVFDLYCGSGNYSLPLHGLVGRVFGCDDNPLGIAMAQINAERNGITNAAYVCGDAANVLQRRKDLGWPEQADLVIVDPARYGMSAAVIGELGQMRPPRLFYISNHRESFIRDARQLLAAGFKPEKLELVDFFPHTPHLDIVSIWTHSGSSTGPNSV
ncbi:MAG: class I SAM-dependent RNA methyltransferase [Turneriella sp.]|nr:class I SAM-dependent RNA methyltransferase [Turneriella sp.]